MYDNHKVVTTVLRSSLDIRLIKIKMDWTIKLVYLCMDKGILSLVLRWLYPGATRLYSRYWKKIKRVFVVVYWNQRICGVCVNGKYVSDNFEISSEIKTVCGLLTVETRFHGLKTNTHEPEQYACPFSSVIRGNASDFILKRNHRLY